MCRDGPREEAPSRQLKRGIPNAAASLTGEAVATPAKPTPDPSALRQESGGPDEDAKAEPAPVLSEDEAADDTTGGKSSGAGGQGTSLAAAQGRRGPNSGSAGHESSETGMVGQRVTRMQLRNSLPLPLPPVTRLFGFIFSWIFLSLVNVFEAFAADSKD